MHDPARIARRLSQQMRPDREAYRARVALCDIIERDGVVAALDAEARAILDAIRARGRSTTAEDDRLAVLTREHNARVATLRKDIAAIDPQSHRMAEHLAGASDERFVRDVIAAAGGAR